MIKEAASLSDGKVILAGHSAGGMTISAVAEQVPDLLLAVVYLAGFMVPNGMPLLAMLQHETLSSALAPGLFVGDPAAIGATRINVGSTDVSDSDRRKITAYVHLFRSGDFDAIRAMLADDVKLDLVNRLQLQGRDKIGLYLKLCGRDEMAVRPRRG